jgi:aminopeptidase N
VQQVFEVRTHELSSAYFNHLFPAYRASPEVLARSEALLASLTAPESGAPTSRPRLPVLVRLLREANDELARALACQARCAAEESLL